MGNEITLPLREGGAPRGAVGTILFSPRLVGTGNLSNVDWPQRKVTHEKVSHSAWTEFVSRYCGNNPVGRPNSKRPNGRKFLCRMQLGRRMLAGP